jgi:hypothetical protein
LRYRIELPESDESVWSIHLPSGMVSIPTVQETDPWSSGTAYFSLLSWCGAHSPPYVATKLLMRSPFLEFSAFYYIPTRSK